MAVNALTLEGIKITAAIAAIGIGSWALLAYRGRHDGR